MTKAVLAVLLNWKRPGNVRLVAAAIRLQTHPCHLALIECSPGSAQHALPPDVLGMADTAFSVSTNIGPASRFMAPLALPQYRHTCFFVDDHLPGPRHVEWLLGCAEKLHPDYATIGMDGRRIRGGEILRRKAKLHAADPTPVDFITSSELMLTARVQHALTFRDAMQQDYGGEFSTFEDDLILCFGVQMAMRARLRSNCPCYVTPAPPSEAESWQAKRLDDGGPAVSLCGRPDHQARRNQFVGQAIRLGWRPLEMLE